MKLVNEGNILMDFEWKVIMDTLSSKNSSNKSVTFSCDKSKFVDPSYIPFFVEPQYGTVEAGKTVVCTIKFSPLDVNEYDAKLACR